MKTSVSSLDVFSVGTDGLVPGPSSSSTTSYLRASGSWGTPTNTTYSVFSTSSNGLCPKSGTSSTSKFLTAAGTWASISTSSGGSSGGGDSGGSTTSKTWTTVATKTVSGTVIELSNDGGTYESSTGYYKYMHVWTSDQTSSVNTTVSFSVSDSSYANASWQITCALSSACDSFTALKSSYISSSSGTATSAGVISVSVTVTATIGMVSGSSSVSELCCRLTESDAYSSGENCHNYTPGITLTLQVYI